MSYPPFETGDDAGYSFSGYPVSMASEGKPLLLIAFGNEGSHNDLLFP